MKNKFYFLNLTRFEKKSEEKFFKIGTMFINSKSVTYNRRADYIAYKAIRRKRISNRLYDKVHKDIYNQFRNETGLNVSDEVLSSIVSFWFDTLEHEAGEGNSLLISKFGKFSFSEDLLNYNEVCKQFNVKQDVKHSLMTLGLVDHKLDANIEAYNNHNFDDLENLLQC